MINKIVVIQPKSEPMMDQESNPLADSGPKVEVNPNDVNTFDIVRASQYGIYDRVVHLVENGYNVNQPDIENVSILHWAAINNRIEIVR